MPDDRLNTSSDPHSRIEELEHQVRELSGLVARMIEQQVHPPLAAADPPPENGHPAQLEFEANGDPHLGLTEVMESLGHRLEQALGGEEGEPLESRIGGIWLSKIAAILLMTVVALGFAMTMRDAGLGAWQKVIAGYTLAVFGVGFGVLSRDKNDVLPQTMLGCGLAAFYFTTYAAGFLTDTRLISDPRVGVAVSAGALILVSLVIHLRQSQGAAGITLFLIFYTIVLSMRGSPSVTEVTYAFGTCAALASAALIFHLKHRWMSFTWGALLATHLTYVFFFEAKPPALELTTQEYFWLSNGTLAFIYFLFSTACVTDARRTGEYQRTVVPMCVLNSALFVAIAWMAVRDAYPDQVWVFAALTSAAMAIFALYAHLSGPRSNYLFQIFAVKSVVLFTLALQSYLPPEWFVPAAALECLALAIWHQRSGLVIFKLLNVVLLVLTILSAIASVRLMNSVPLGPWIIPANWFACTAAVFVFTLAAAWYEHFVRRLPADQRALQGQWVLADTALDLRSSTVAMLHATAAAVVLMVITIIDLSESMTLPYILAAESVTLVLWGLVLRAPQVDVAGILVLAASHMTYHMFLLIDRTAFAANTYFAEYTVAIAFVTYLGGFLWERYLSRIEGGSGLQHDFLAGIPYLASTIMLATLVTHELQPQYASVLLNVLAVVLLLASALGRLTGIRVSGILAIALGTALFYREMYNFADPLSQKPHFFVSLAVLLLCFVATERLVLLWGKGQREVHDGTPDFVRTLLVVVATLLGALALWEAAPEHRLSLNLLVMSIIAMVFGVAFGEVRYRWAAIAIYLAALARAYGYDLTTLAPTYRFLSFAGLCIPLLIVSWGYSRYRARTLRELRTRQRSGEHGQQA